MGRTAAVPLLPTVQRGSASAGAGPCLAGALHRAAGGLLAGLLTFFRAVTFALVFSHASPALDPSFCFFLHSLLIGTVVSQAIYLAAHRLPWIVSCPASMAVPLHVSMLRTAVVGVAAPREAALAGLAALGLASLATAGSLLLLLSFVSSKLDALKGSFPQPLIFGLFASLGAAMVHSGVGLAQAAAPPGGAGAQVACGLLSGVLTRLLSRSKRWGRSPGLLPVMLMSQTLLFWAVVWVNRVLSGEGDWSGWFFKPFMAVPLSDYLDLWAEAFTPATWADPGGALPRLCRSSAFWGQVVTLVFVLTLDLLTGLVVPLERLVRETLPCGKEMAVAAGCCAATACAGGGGASFASLSFSRLSFEAGGGGGGGGAGAGPAAPGVAWVNRCAGGVGVVLVPVLGLTSLGPGVLKVIPKFVIAGLLTNIGLGYVLEGLWDSRTLILALAPGEYGVVLAVLALSVVLGLPQAMTTGLLLLSFMFVLRYAQGEVLQLSCTLKDLPSLRSRRHRSPAEWSCLQPLLSRVLVIRTNCSHLFFGSVAAIIAVASPGTCADEEDELRSRFVLLDLESVRTVDSSALSALERVQGGGATLVVGLRMDLMATFQEVLGKSTLRFFRSMDAALEFCEDRLLDEAGRGIGVRSFVPPSPKGPGVAPAPRRRLAETTLASPLPRQAALALLAGCLPAATAKLLENLLDSAFVERSTPMRGSVVAEQGSTLRGMYVCLRGTLVLYGGAVRLPRLVHETLGVDVNVKGLVGGRRSQSGMSLPGDPAFDPRPAVEMGPGEACCEGALLSPVPLRLPGNLVAGAACELLLVRREAVLGLELVPDRQLALELHRALARRLLVQVQEQSAAPASGWLEGLRGAGLEVAGTGRANTFMSAAGTKVRRARSLSQ